MMLPTKTTEAIVALRELLAKSLLLCPQHKSLSPDEIERDLLKVGVKWYVFVSSSSIAVDDCLAVDEW